MITRNYFYEVRIIHICIHTYIHTPIIEYKKIQHTYTLRLPLKLPYNYTHTPTMLNFSLLSKLDFTLDIIPMNYSIAFNLLFLHFSVQPFLF